MNKYFSKLLDSNRFLFILSFVISALLWVYVAVYVNNEHTKTIVDVPINTQYVQAAYQNLGLDIIETDIKAVNISVTGPRSVIGDISADDIIVYPTVTGVDGAGKYSLTLTADKVSSIKNFTINSISRNSVNIRFDRVVTKEFPIEIDVSTVTVAGEFMASKPYTTPSKITITGPEYKMNTISRVVAATISNGTLNQSAILPSKIILYDENDAEIGQELLAFDVNTVDITIPVLKDITVPIKVEYVNVPQGFNTDNLKLKLSQEQIRIAVPTQLASSITQFVVGYIDLQNIELDKTYEFDIKLPSGYISLDEVTKVTAKVSSANLTERVVSLSEIKVINDSNNKIEVLTQIINNVTVIGTPAAINNLSSSSVIALIDASRLSVAQGQQTVEVSVIIPSTDAAFVTGIYTVTIKT